MVNADNIEKAKDLLWEHCTKCQYHGEDGCKRPGGVCDVDDAWGWLDAAADDDEDNIEIAKNRLQRYCDSCALHSKQAFCDNCRVNLARVLLEANHV
jgi:hypothetical protein